MDEATDTGTGNRPFRFTARLRRWRTHFHCLACGEYFPRERPYCPSCKTHKGGRGQNMPSAGSM